MQNELFAASYITGAHRAESLSLDGAVRAIANMIEMSHTDLHTEQCMFDGRSINVWFVYAPGACVGTVRTISLV